MYLLCFTVTKFSIRINLRSYPNNTSLTKRTSITFLHSENSYTYIYEVQTRSTRRAFSASLCNDVWVLLLHIYTLRCYTHTLHNYLHYMNNYSSLFNKSSTSCVCICLGYSFWKCTFVWNNIVFNKINLMAHPVTVSWF